MSDSIAENIALSMRTNPDNWVMHPLYAEENRYVNKSADISFRFCEMALPNFIHMTKPISKYLDYFEMRTIRKAVKVLREYKLHQAVLEEGEK